MQIKPTYYYDIYNITNRKTTGQWLMLDYHIILLCILQWQNALCEHIHTLTALNCIKDKYFTSAKNSQQILMKLSYFPKIAQWHGSKTYFLKIGLWEIMYAD
jgi:hypothetical protein